MHIGQRSFYFHSRERPVVGGADMGIHGAVCWLRYLGWDRLMTTGQPSIS